MNCGSCGASNPQGNDYCGSCGARLSPTGNSSFEGNTASQVMRRLHPMGVGDIIDETIRLYRRNFRTFVGIVAVLQVPLVVLQMVQLAIVGPRFFDFASLATGDQSQLGPLIFWLVSSLVLGVLSIFAFVIIQAALANAISERYLDRKITAGNAYRVALGCFWRILGNGLLVGIILVLLFMTFLGIPFAIWLMIRWSFAVETIVLEGKGVRGALSRSSALVKGSWWRVLGVFIVAIVLQFLVASIPGGVIGLVVAGVATLVSPGAIYVATIINTLIGAVFGILSAPLVPTISVLLYYDLRIRKEGFDLQVLAERLGQGRPPAVEGQL